MGHAHVADDGCAGQPARAGQDLRRAGQKFSSCRRSHLRDAGRACAGNAGQRLDEGRVLFQLLQGQQGQGIQRAGDGLSAVVAAERTQRENGVRSDCGQADPAALPLPQRRTAGRAGGFDGAGG